MTALVVDVKVGIVRNGREALVNLHGARAGERRRGRPVGGLFFAERCLLVLFLCGARRLFVLLRLFVFF